MKYYKLKKLMNGTAESNYWLGFIMADGYLTKNRLKIGVSSKDEEHLIKLSNYVGYGNVITESRTTNFGTFMTSQLSIMDSDTIPKIRNLFGMSDNKKSHNPINLNQLSDDDLIPFLIGYIDGDGTINKQTNREDSVIRFHIHGNWLIVLDSIRVRLENIVGVDIPTPKITKYGNCSWQLTNSVVTTYLKKECLQLELPFLKRKWDRINENHVSRYVKSRDRLKQVKNLLSKGYRNKEICEELNIHPSTVSKIIKRNGLSYQT